MHDRCPPPLVVHILLCCWMIHHVFQVACVPSEPDGTYVLGITTGMVVKINVTLNGEAVW